MSILPSYHHHPHLYPPSQVDTIVQSTNSADVAPLVVLTSVIWESVASATPHPKPAIFAASGDHSDRRGGGWLARLTRMLRPFHSLSWFMLMAL